MARMVDMIRQSAVPPNLLRAAAKGALSVPPAEMIEILVLLTQNPVFTEQARMTLASWDETTCLAAASDPHTPREVLDYMVDPRNRRPGLFAALLENPAVPEAKLAEIAAAAGREVTGQMLASPRVGKSRVVLQALAGNRELHDAERVHIQSLLAALPAASQPAENQAADSDSIANDEEIRAFLAEHAAEIAADEGKPFHVIGGIEETDIPPEAPVAVTAAAAGHAAAVAPAPEQEKKAKSVLQKIAALKVGERVQLAMKGSKDERFILVRDGAKVVPQAVLESPKLTDTEAEMFASMKNVQEVVFRGLSSKRKFVKNYRIQRNLAFNPKVPIDLALGLVNNLLLSDLKSLSINKEVPDTVRKAALRLFVQKSDTRRR
ncbi:MAG TPA: hypothetical protein VGR48_14545 [Terriglobales bacterium]|nr:hypothetical protein [Terriglobales bacterium]